jgi:hypothetical protein
MHVPQVVVRYSPYVILKFQFLVISLWYCMGFDLVIVAINFRCLINRHKYQARL